MPLHTPSAHKSTPHDPGCNPMPHEAPRRKSRSGSPRPLQSVQPKPTRQRQRAPAPEARKSGHPRRTGPTSLPAPIRAIAKDAARSTHTLPPHRTPGLPAEGSRPQSGPSHRPANAADQSAHPKPQPATPPFDWEPPSDAQFGAPLRSSRKTHLQDGMTEKSKGRNHGPDASLRWDRDRRAVSRPAGPGRRAVRG